MSEWKEIELGQVADVRGGKRLPKGEALSEFPTNHPYIRTRDIANHKIKINELLFVPDDIFSSISNYTVEENDLIISIVGTIGLCAVIPKELHLASLTENCAKIVNINNKQINRTFLFYYLISEEGQAEIESRSVGSTQPKLPLYNIKSIKIPVPPLPEQRAIASVLSSLDDKIDLLHRENKTLEAMAETLFRQWFIEEADEGWEEVPLSFLGDIVCGKTPPTKRKEYFGGNIPFIKIPDMRGNTFVFQTSDTLTEEGEQSQNNKTLPPKSICVSCIATVGLVSMTAKESQTNQQINSIVPKKDFYRYYLYLFMKNSVDLLIAMASGGTATLNLNTGDFSKIEVTLPNEYELKKFHKTVEPMFDRIYLNQTQIRTLEKLRDTLLPKLMRGEVRIQY